MTPEQLFFDLDFPDKREAALRQLRTDDRKALRRAVLRWILSEDKPTACAMDVVTRISRIRADVAAFWSAPTQNPRREGPRRIYQPRRSTIIQCYVERDECWPDCSRALDLLPELRKLKERLGKIEARLRENEPHLRADDGLFEELAEWRYEKTRDREYHRIRRQIEKCEHALYNGTKFERIRTAALADQLYLAVPAHTVQPEELADGWGLLWVHPNLRVEIKSPATFRDCLPENRMHLVQNIAAAATAAVLFAAGVRRSKDAGYYLTRPPRGHRAPLPGGPGA